MGSRRLDSLNSAFSIARSRRAALRLFGTMTAAAAMVGVGNRSTSASAQSGSGLTRAEARVLAEGIASALTEDPDRLDEWVTDDVIGHVPLAPEGSGKGLPGLKEKANVIREAIPDAKITVEHFAVDGDTITAHGEIYGNHTGSLVLIQATGKPIRIQYVIFTKIADGKVAEYWYQLDVLGALQQLDMFSLDQLEDDGGY